MSTKRMAVRAATLGAAALPLLVHGSARARSVTSWIAPRISGSIITYGATVDTTCNGTSCSHHLSLERDGGFGWVTIEQSKRPEGNGEQTVPCDQEGRQDSYKSHFHTTTTQLGQTTVGQVGVPTPVDVTDTNDSSAVTLTCPDLPDPK